MSRRTVYTCDRCTRDIGDDDQVYSLHNSQTDVGFDLCVRCWGTFINLFIGGLEVKSVS